VNPGIGEFVNLLNRKKKTEKRKQLKKLSINKYQLTIKLLVRRKQEIENRE
jgi:hypothetical protein